MKLTDKQVQDFMKSLYKNGDSELKKLFKHQLTMKNDVLSEVADIMLIYVIENDVMTMTTLEQDKEMKKLGNLVNSYMKADAKMQIDIINSLLSNTVNGTFELYSYNAKRKEVKKIIEDHYKGMHFSDRVWDNENAVAKHMKKEIEDFIKGKTSINKIKKNVESLFNTSAYNAKRLTDTEISRCANSAFDRFAEEVGIKKVRYNAELEACPICKPYDGEPFDFDKKLDLPRHPLCRCYYDIADENYIENNSKSDIMKSRAVSGALNPYSTEAQNHAEQYYESIRHMKTDTKKISENVGWKQNAIDKIKEHVFIKEHDLGNDAKERFYPSYDMAQSWQRLIEGKSVKEQDLVLLKHEYLELTLMKKGFSQANAHSMASKKHNFAKYTK